jgi:hypothetical protein
MHPVCRLIYRNCSNRTSLNFLIVCVLFIIIISVINHQQNKENNNFNELNDERNVESIINRIRDIQIFNQAYKFNITYEIKIDGIPNWINYYRISHLFDFYWLQTGGYKWHLQQMMDFKSSSTNQRTHFYNQSYLFNYLQHHPEYGVIIDTAPDPFPALFPSLPRTSSSLNKICIHLGILNYWYPCYKTTKIISSFIPKPLFTIGGSSSSSETIHYDEIIYLFDNKFQTINETFFVTQILPRLIRLLALVPQTAVILSPYFNSEINYVNNYTNLLFQRGVLNNTERLIRYNPNKSYQAHAIYSTSSPRSDLVLLQRILTESQSSVKRDLILIIRNNLDNNNYIETTQIISLFELPAKYQYLQTHEYNENAYDIDNISELFRRAMIVIGMPSDTLSRIVWCSPGTHIIEIGQPNMTTDYYEISLQLKFTYWLASIAKNNQIDVTDFRNLIMKVFTYIDV